MKDTTWSRAKIQGVMRSIDRGLSSKLRLVEKLANKCVKVRFESSLYVLGEYEANAFTVLSALRDVINVPLLVYIDENYTAKRRVMMRQYVKGEKLSDMLSKRSYQPELMGQLERMHNCNVTLGKLDHEEIIISERGASYVGFSKYSVGTQGDFRNRCEQDIMRVEEIFL